MKEKPTIAMVDFRLSGHHPYYLATFAKHFTNLGCDYHLFVKSEEECREKLKLAVPSLQLKNIAIHEIESANMWERTFGCRTYFRLKQLNREISEVERTYSKDFDLVYFPYIDDLVQYDFILPYLLKSPFKRHFSGLLMEPRLKLLKRPKVPISLFTSTWLELPGANFETLGVLVEDAAEEVQALLEKPIVHYPDICSTNTIEQPQDPICQKIIKQKGNRVVTSLLGSILPHKSLDLFLECVKQADPSKYLFVIAGHIAKDKFTPENLELLQPLLTTKRENVLIFDQWIPSEAVFDTIIKHSDALYAHYRNFPKSSNILSKAAYHKKPVIVSNQYLLGKRVDQYNLGFSLPESEVPGLFKNDQIMNWTVEESSRKEFLDLHSEARLQTIFKNLVE